MLLILLLLLLFLLLLLLLLLLLFLLSLLLLLLLLLLHLLLLLYQPGLQPRCHPDWLVLGLQSEHLAFLQRTGVDVDGQLSSQLLDVKTDVEWSRSVSDVCLFSTGDQLVVLVEVRRDPPGLPGHCPQCRDDPPGLPGHYPHCRYDPSSAIVLVGDCEVTVLCRTACLYSEETVLLSADGWVDLDQLLADVGLLLVLHRLRAQHSETGRTWRGFLVKLGVCLFSVFVLGPSTQLLLIDRQTRG